MHKWKKQKKQFQNQKKTNRESNYQKPQNKTGDYGQKRKPGDYLK